MEQLNLVHLRGNVGSVKTSALADGRTVSNINVATTVIYNTIGSDSATKETQWTTCVMFSNKKTPDPETITVGMAIEVKGRLRSRHYTGSDNMEHYNTEVMVSEITLLPGERLNPIVR